MNHVQLNTLDTSSPFLNFEKVHFTYLVMYLKYDKLLLDPVQTATLGTVSLGLHCLLRFVWIFRKNMVSSCEKITHS